MHALALAGSAWSASAPRATIFTSGPTAALDKATEGMPSYQAALRSGEALPKLRLLHQLLGVPNTSALYHDSL